MQNVEFKQMILNDGLHLKYNALDRVVHLGQTEEERKQAMYLQLIYADDFAGRYNVDIEEVIHQTELINKAYYARLGRVQRRTYLMCELGACFLTLTFTDEVLEKTTEQTRRKYVQRFLTDYEQPYIANVDYGAENGREHYHCLVCIPYCDCCSHDWDYGNVCFEEVGTQRIYRRYRDSDGHWCIKFTERKHIRRDDSPEYNYKRLSRYVNKLSQHSLKMTGCGKRLMYSREIDKNLVDLARWFDEDNNTTFVDNLPTGWQCYL